jgi:hypothetical protein
MAEGPQPQPKQWTIEEIVEDPDGWHRATLDRVRRENPQMTDEQIENNWQAAKFILGL